MSLSSEKLDSTFAFKCNSYRYAVAAEPGRDFTSQRADRRLRGAHRGHRRKGAAGAGQGAESVVVASYIPFASPSSSLNTLKRTAFFMYVLVKFLRAPFTRYIPFASPSSLKLTAFFRAPWLLGVKRSSPSGWRWTCSGTWSRSRLGCTS